MVQARAGAEKHTTFALNGSQWRCPWAIPDSTRTARTKAHVLYTFIAAYA